MGWLHLRPFTAMAAALLVSGLTGCVPGIVPVGINPSIPQHFLDQRARAAAVDARWWREFHQPELDRFAARTLADNFDIAAAKARIVQAGAAARLAGAPLLPSLTLNGNYSHAKSSANDGPINPPAQDSHQLGLTASFELDFWGKNRATADAAQKTAIASVFDAETVRLASLAATANAYFAVLAAREQAANTLNNLRNARAVLALIGKQLAAGTATALDQAQQQNIVDTLAASVPPLRLSVAQNEDALALLLGVPPESVRVRGATLSGVRLPRVAPGLPSQILERRPDVASAEMQLEANAASLTAARAAFFPAITLTGQAGYQSPSLLSLFRPRNLFYSLAAGLTQPIFNNGSLQSSFDQTKGRQDELIANYKKSVISAFSDVDKALASLRYLGQQEALQRRALASSQKAFDLSQMQLKAGLVNLVTLLNTETSLFTARNSLVATRLARLNALVSLYQALGGGWQGGDGHGSTIR